MVEKDGDEDCKYLIATSEQPLACYHFNEGIHKERFPLRSRPPRRLAVTSPPPVHGGMGAWGHRCGPRLTAHAALREDDSAILTSLEKHLVATLVKILKQGDVADKMVLYATLCMQHVGSLHEGKESGYTRTHFA